MKKNNKKIFNFILIPSLSFAPASCITSCKWDEKDAPPEEEEDIEFYVKDKIIVTYNTDFSLSFFCTNNEIKNVDLAISKTSEDKFCILSNEIELTRGAGTINFRFDSTYTQNLSINFDLSISYIQDGILKEYKLENFLVNYYVKKPEFEDLVTLDSYTSEQDNYHVFDYYFTFYNDSIKDKSVLVQLSTSEFFSPDLNLTSNYVSAYKEGENWKIKVEVNLKLDIIQNITESFNLQITFTNSYGNTQVVDFQNLTCKFNKKTTNTIPKDYFNVSYEDGQQIVNGFRSDSINELEFSNTNYNVIEFPEGTTKIINDNGSDYSIFPSINKIKFPKTVTEIQDGCFSTLYDLYDIDLNDYGDNIPDWFIDSEKSYFAKDKLNFSSGYIWIGNYNLTDDQKKQTISNLGLQEYWLLCSPDLYTDKDFFTYSEDGTEITGIVEDKKEEIKNIKIIKIPEGIKSIKEEALDDFKTKPYEKVIDNKISYETRRLVLSSSITTLPDLIFTYGGISGPIIMNCEHLDQIPNGCFAFCNKYKIEYIPYIEQEPIYILFDDSYDIESVGSYAFAGVSLLNKKIEFTQSLSNIGDYAFYGNKFETITFTKNIKSVGVYAFANEDSSNPTIKDVNLKCYCEILNPDDHEIVQTYLYDWLDSGSYLFYNSCVGDGVIHAYQAIETLWLRQITLKHPREDYDKWSERLDHKIEDFINSLGIPLSWNIDWYL